MTTPTIEPASIVAGDTITWQKSLADYPATEWTLKYRLLNSAGKIDITAAASGSDHLVTVSSTTSAAFTAGDYDYLAWVEKTGARRSVGTGRITVVANLATAATYDGRSDARIVYEALLAGYKSHVEAGNGFVAEVKMGERGMKFNTAADWLTQINFWKAQVLSEERAAKIAAGLPAGNRVLVRF